MKKIKHQPSGYEKTLEKLETTIEAIDPDTTVSMCDVFSMAGVTDTNKAIRAAATMLLLKYGIACRG